MHKSKDVIGFPLPSPSSSSFSHPSCDVGPPRCAISRTLAWSVSLPPSLPLASMSSSSSAPTPPGHLLFLGLPFPSLHLLLSSFLGKCHFRLRERGERGPLSQSVFILPRGAIPVKPDDYLARFLSPVRGSSSKRTSI